MTNCCNKCGKETCGCPREFLSITHKPNSFTDWLFSQGGMTSEVDFRPLAYYGQTDTSLSVDQIKRLLKYQAERHIDSLTAEELGSILRLSDLSDVDNSDVKDSSLFVYSRENDCGEGCEGINDHWEGWNPEGENLVDTLNNPLGYSADGKLKALNPPADSVTDEYHLLGWKPNDGVGYVPISTGSVVKGQTATLHIVKDTGEIFYVND